MPKYIRPGNLITDRKTTKLVKQKKFISEDEYEMKASVIKELLDELDLENFQNIENIKNNYEIFSKVRDEVSNKIEDIINYIDEIKNEDYDIEQIKAIAKEKIEKEIYERYKIYSNIDSEYVYKNLNIEDANKHISNIKYNDENVINEKYKRINIFEKKLIDNTIYKIKNIKDNDLIILYDENECNVKNINEFCIEDRYNKINTNNKTIENYNFNGKLNEDCIFKDNVKYVNKTYGVKIVSIKKQCTKMSFYYETDSNVDSDISIYLYIDGVYKNRYTSASWTQVTIDNLTDEEHEFTWVLYSSSSSYNYYSYIKTIAFNDIVETDRSKFSNNGNIPLADIPSNSNCINGSSSSTPFYNTTTGFKIVSIKKQCTKMSFYFKAYDNTYSNNSIYLYIDGVYKNRYTNTSWRQITIDDYLTDEEHEFTWVLYSYNDSYYSCIDTIAFNDIVETDSSKFSNNGNIPLADIPSNDNCIYGDSTPFYNEDTGFKIVSIKKQCTKMSFYYKTYNDSDNNNSRLYLYIDGVYKNRYAIDSWTQITIDNLTDEEHEFTWVLYSYNDFCYSCIDTIAFNDIVETDRSKFSNNGNIPLADIPLSNIPSDYKNGSNTSTPFYNNTISIKIVSIKKQCTKMSFYCKNKNNTNYYNSIYLYIDGVYKDRYTSTSWRQITIDNLTDEEHEFTWVLYSYNDSYYSCIDTIAFNDIVFNYMITNNIVDDLNINMINNKKLIYELLYNKLYSIKINNFKIYKRYKSENNSVFYIITDKIIYIIDNFYYFYYILKNNDIKEFKLLIYNENINDEKECFKIDKYDSINRKNELLIDKKNSNKIIEIINSSKEIEVYKTIE